MQKDQTDPIPTQEVVDYSLKQLEMKLMSMVSWRELHSFSGKYSKDFVTSLLLDKTTLLTPNNILLN